MLIAKIILLFVSSANKKEIITEFSIKNQKRTKEKLHKKKKQLQRIRRRMRWQSVQQQTVQNTSILNVLRLIQENNILSLSTLILFISDVLFIIAINVE